MAMHPNEQLIHQFYSAFKGRDFKTMQDCYGDEATFRDPVFIGLNEREVKAMWEMLCRNGKDLRIEFDEVWANETEGGAHWVARYTFSLTGNRVENRIKASFRFSDGRIVTHTDDFSFYVWAKQALGIKGLLLGWTSMVRSKVQEKARRNLNLFMEKKG